MRRGALLFGLAVSACDGGGRAGDAATGDSPIGPTPDECVTSVTAGSHTFVCDGITYDVEVPAGCDAAGCGVILDVHGFGMSSALEEANSRLRALGGAAGFLVIQPNAPGTMLGLPSWSPADDAKVFTFVQRIARIWQSDPDRLHVAGLSQGGWMTWRLLCEHADEIASIAPLAAGTSRCPAILDMPSCSFTGAELPAAEVDIFYVHGELDQRVPYASCAAPQRDAIVEAWAMTEQLPASGGDGFTRRRFTSAAGTTFDFLSHELTSETVTAVGPLGGHCVPGSTEPTFGCDTPGGFAWGEAVVGFFVAHRRR